MDNCGELNVLFCSGVRSKWCVQGAGSCQCIRNVTVKNNDHLSTELNLLIKFTDIMSVLFIKIKQTISKLYDLFLVR